MTKDMTTGAITPLLVKFTIPLVLGNLFQLTYNAADSIIVGKFVGEDALAAVGTSNPRMMGRPSVDHGTDFYHAGKGNGNELSLVNAIKYAVKMTGRAN